MTEWGGQVHSGCGNLENSELPTSGSTPTICRSSPSSDTLPDANPTLPPRPARSWPLHPRGHPLVDRWILPLRFLQIENRQGSPFRNPFLKRDEHDQKGGYFFPPFSKGDLLEGQIQGEERARTSLRGRCFLGSMIRFDNFVPLGIEFQVTLFEVEF